MRVAQIVGTVTLSRSHPTLVGAVLKIARPMSLAAIAADESPTTEELVVYDELGAGHGHRILLSEGAEAAQPFQPEIKPVDAYNAGIIDEISLH